MFWLDQGMLKDLFLHQFGTTNLGLLSFVHFMKYYFYWWLYFVFTLGPSSFWVLPITWDCPAVPWLRCYTLKAKASILAQFWSVKSYEQLLKMLYVRSAIAKSVVSFTFSRSIIFISVADPHHFHADANPDPDPACHFHADPSVQIKAQNLEKVLQ
jgi:hypothetical protein